MPLRLWCLGDAIGQLADLGDQERDVRVRVEVERYVQGQLGVVRPALRGVDRRAERWQELLPRAGGDQPIPVQEALLLVVVLELIELLGVGGNVGLVRVVVQQHQHARLVGLQHHRNALLVEDEPVLRPVVPGVAGEQQLGQQALGPRAALVALPLDGIAAGLVAVHRQRSPGHVPGCTYMAVLREAVTQSGVEHLDPALLHLVRLVHASPRVLPTTQPGVIRIRRHPREIIELRGAPTYPAHEALRFVELEMNARLKARTPAHVEERDHGGLPKALRALAEQHARRARIPERVRYLDQAHREGLSRPGRPTAEHLRVLLIVHQVPRVARTLAERANAHRGRYGGQQLTFRHPCWRASPEPSPPEWPPRQGSRIPSGRAGPDGSCQATSTWSHRPPSPARTA